MTYPKFETPGQRQMWLDAITNIKVEPLPSEYDSETWDSVPSEDDATLSDEELEAISAEVSDEELDEAVISEEASYTFDPDLKAVKIEDNGYTVHGLYNTEYEDLFYKIWIEYNGEIVYQNDYGKEVHDNNKISDDMVDDFLDKLVSYAMDVDPNLHESFQIVEEEALEELVKLKDYDKVLSTVTLDDAEDDKDEIRRIAHALAIHKRENDGNYDPKVQKELDRLIKDTASAQKYFESIFNKIMSGKEMSMAVKKDNHNKMNKIKADGKALIPKLLKPKKSIKEEALEEDFSNINMLQGMKGKSVTLKLKDGSSIDVASDEAKIIAKRYAELKGDLQKKFADLLNKSQQSFLIAYRDAYKD